MKLNHIYSASQPQIDLYHIFGGLKGVSFKIYSVNCCNNKLTIVAATIGRFAKFFHQAISCDFCCQLDINHNAELIHK